jgi:hypothetical protein
MPERDEQYGGRLTVQMERTKYGPWKTAWCRANGRRLASRHPLSLTRPFWAPSDWQL